MAFLLVALILVGLIVWALAKGPDLPAKTKASQLTNPHPAPVRRLQVKVEDKTRPTPRHRSFAGSSSRKMQISVWYPAGPAKPGPLVVYSHGFASNNKECKYIIRQLASLGYVVAAPNFPATNWKAPGGPYIQDVVNQPADQSHIIDQLLTWNKIADNPLAGRIDPERIGAMGTSLGGLATTLLVFDRARLDSRVKAAVTRAGLHAMFAPAFYAHRSLPYRLVAGTSDLLAPYTTNAAAIAADIPGAIFVTINRGSHLGFIDHGRYLRFMRTPDPLGCLVVRMSLKRNPLTCGFEIIGTAEDGVRTDSSPEFCGMESPPSAMDPRLQQRISSVAVTAFFQSRFSPIEEERAAMHRYLIEDLQKELKDVSVFCKR